VVQRWSPSRNDLELDPGLQAQIKKEEFTPNIDYLALKDGILLEDTTALKYADQAVLLYSLVG
jgi:hypothetical protein